MINDSHRVGAESQRSDGGINADLAANIPNHLVGADKRLVRAGEFFKGYRYSKEIMHVLGGNTQMGALIRDCALDLLEFEEVRNIQPYKGHEHHSIRAFERIFKELEGRDLTDLEFTPEDSVFLATTGVGDVLRRPLIEGSFAQKLQRRITAKNPEEHEIKELVVSIAQVSVYERFMKNKDAKYHIMERYPDHPSLSILVEDARELDNLLKVDVETGEQSVDDAISMAKHGSSSAIRALSLAKRNRDKDEKKCSLFESVMEKAWVVAEEYEGYRANSGRLWKIDHGDFYFTDTGHMYKQGTVISGLKKIMKPNNKPLVCNTHTLLLVAENDRGDASMFAMAWGGEVENLEMCSARSPQSPLEAYGIYATKKRTMEVVKEQDPDVRLTCQLDCELDDGSDAGIEIARELKRRYGERVRICMMYSSNEEKLPAISRLKDEGIIDHFWHKKDFSLESMVEKINEINK